MSELCSIQGIRLFLKVWRFCQMYKSTTNFIKGITAGAVAGIAVTAVGSKMMKDNKHLKKSVNKAMHAAGDVIGNMESMFTK